MKALLGKIGKYIETARSEGARLFYYKHIYARNIIKTRPIVCDKQGRIELHTLACQFDFLNTLWCLKTFYYFSGIRPRLVIYDDGSLSEAAIRTFYGHFVNCQVVRHDEFHRDMEDFLKAYRMCLKYSRIKEFYCALKLFGPMYYAKSEYVLYLDSDILFFKKPDEMLKCMESGTPFYMSDYQDAYSYPVEFLKNLLNIKLPHNINAGLSCFSKRNFAGNLDLAEFYFKNVYELADRDVQANRHEQTLAAIFLSKANAVRLGGEYQISKERITDKTISHHFVDDGSRNNFYALGLSRLKSAGFIEKVNNNNKTA